MITNLLNILPMLLGLTQATKHAVAANSPVKPVEPEFTAPVPDVSTPVTAPVPVVQPSTDDRSSWEKPIRDFNAKPKLTDGFSWGYHNHSEDQFIMGTTVLHADFTQAVTYAVRLLDEDILKLKKKINECGQMTPTHKANLELDLEHFSTKRTYWETQLTLPRSVEYAPSYEQFRSGYEAGMQRYHEDKAYGDANGLTHLIP